MSKKDRIKFMTTMGNPLARSRDAQVETHFLRIQFTRDEALAVSEAITSIRETDPAAPTFTLIRSICLDLAQQHIDEAKLIENMAKWRTRAMLARVLAEEDYQVTLSLLDRYKKEQEEKAVRREESETKKKKPLTTPKPEADAPPTVPKIRREFVPLPRKK